MRGRSELGTLSKVITETVPGRDKTNTRKSIREEVQITLRSKELLFTQSINKTWEKIKSQIKVERLILTGRLSRDKRGAESERNKGGREKEQIMQNTMNERVSGFCMIT